MKDKLVFGTNKIGSLRDFTKNGTFKSGSKSGKKHMLGYGAYRDVDHALEINEQKQLSAMQFDENEISGTSSPMAKKEEKKSL